MNPQLLPFLRCPVSFATDLAIEVLDQDQAGDVIEGIVYSPSQGYWYPIEDRVLDLLTGNIANHEDLRRFSVKHENELRRLGLRSAPAAEESLEDQLKLKQKHHFDWYASNNEQTYSSYEQMPFWRATDDLIFDSWRKKVEPAKWLLDVGCAQGRSGYRFADCDLNIVGFDISKQCVRQAVARYKADRFAARMTFLVGDGAASPFVSESFDYILVYGVLHHLPDPGKACRDIARLLKPNGQYFGVENNATFVRPLFDWIQKFTPLWHEEAGPQALMSAANFREWFKSTEVSITTRTSVFMLPHVVNLFGDKARQFLATTNKIGLRLPFIRDNGGLIVIEGIRSGTGAPRPFGQEA